MGYVLGIDLGTSRTAAAVFRDGRATTVPLSDHAATMPSMVFVRPDTALLVGEPARRRGQEEPSRLAREFKRRFGDTTPLVLGETALTAEQLTASLLRHVVDYVAQREGGMPDRVVVAHPANWGAYRRELLRAEVNRAGLPAAQLVTEPDAAAVHYASGERMAVGDVIAVYDLGGGTFDAAVLRRTATGFEQVGEPKGIERLGGIDFDEAVFQHVAAASGLDTAPVTDADLPALLRTRDECQAAKEALSDDLEASVAVIAAGINTRVRLTRGELESMIRGPMRETVQCLKTAILDSGVPLEQISGVLMVGGSSRIPLAAQMVRTELQRPVVYTSNPKEAVALGAARIGAGPTPVAAAAPVVTAPVPPPPPPPPAAAVRPAVVVPAAPRAPQPAAPRKGKGLLIGIGVIAALAIGTGIVVATSGGNDNKTAATTTVATSSAPVTTAGATTTSAAAASTTGAPATTQPPTTPAAPTTTPDVFELYSVVPAVNFFDIPDTLIPPNAQTDAIANGIYYGLVQAHEGGVHIVLHPFFSGTACETAATEDGTECLGGFYTRAEPHYEMDVPASAFIAVNGGDLNRNLRINFVELQHLVNGELPNPAAPSTFSFQPTFLVTVVNGVITRAEQFFIS